MRGGGKKIGLSYGEKLTGSRLAQVSGIVQQRKEKPGGTMENPET